MNKTPTKGSKTGNKGMVLTPRDWRLIELVWRRDALTRVQIARALPFRSVTRANVILLRLVRHRYLERRFQPTLSGTRRAVYLLGRLGSELLGRTGDGVRFKTCSDLFLEHRLAVNDIWLAFDGVRWERYRLASWRADTSLRTLALGCIPDGYLEYTLDHEKFAAFIEADLGTETRSRWNTKVQAYTNLAFSGLFERKFSCRFFRVLVVTTSERRAANLRQAIASHTDRIFWITTRERLNESGPFAPIWQRPKDATLQSLTHS